MNIGVSLSGHADTLSGSMVGAFSPAIHNAWGAGDYERARMLAYQTCKIGTLCVLIFSIPLALEVDHVLLLWLKTPPAYTAGFCLFVLVMNAIDKLSVGHMIAVAANGRIARYQAFLGGSLIATLPLAWFLIKLHVGVYSIGWAMIMTIVVCTLGRVYFARGLVGLSSKYWLVRICLPLSVVTGLCLVIGCLPRLIMGPSLSRLCLTIGIVEFVLIPFSWFLILDPNEREFISKKFDRFKMKFK